MKKEYIYYWYHHMIDDKTRKAIEESISNKDYFKFLDFYKKLNAEGLLQGKYYEEFDSFFPMVFLPDTIAVFEGDKLIDHIDVLNRENFNKITFNECECG